MLRKQASLVLSLVTTLFLVGALVSPAFAAPGRPSATRIGSSCNESGSFSVEVCLYQYGTRSGNNFVLDHYGATFIRQDSQARLTRGVIHTGTLIDGTANMTINAPVSGNEYSFKPPWAGKNENVAGNNFSCGRSELNWARGTGTSYTESYSVCQGTSDLFGSGGDHGGAVNDIAAAANIDAPPGGFLVSIVSAPQKVSDGRYRQTALSGYAPYGRNPSALDLSAGGLRPMSTQQLCSNDGSITVAVCVEQFFTLSGSYVAVDHYGSTATRYDSQARLVRLRTRAGVLGECLPSSCSGTLNTTQDFTQTSPASGVQYTAQPSWHGRFTKFNSSNRYQCGVAFLDWARGTASYTLTLDPPVCEGHQPG